MNIHNIVPNTPTPDRYQFFWCNQPQQVKHKRRCRLDQIPVPKQSLTELQLLHLRHKKQDPAALHPAAPHTLDPEAPLCAVCSRRMAPVCVIVVTCNYCKTPLFVHFFEANDPFTRETKIARMVSLIANKALQRPPGFAACTESTCPSSQPSQPWPIDIRVKVVTHENWVTAATLQPQTQARPKQEAAMAIDTQARTQAQKDMGTTNQEVRI